MFIELLDKSCPCYPGYLFRHLSLPPDFNQIPSFINTESTQFLVSFKDIYEVIKSSINLDKSTCKRKYDVFAALFRSNNKFSSTVTIDGVDTLFLTDRALRYLVDGLILKNRLSSNETVDYILKFLSNVYNTRLDTTEPNVSNKNYAELTSVILPKSYKTSGKTSNYEKYLLFEKDCQRLGIKTEERKKEYLNALCQVSRSAPTVRQIIEKEIEINTFRQFDQQNFDLKSDYSNIPWILKLIFEISTQDKTKSPNAQKTSKHDNKKQIQRYFLIHLFYHVRNASYAGPLCMNLSDIFYIRHEDISYSFNLFSHLGVTQSLPTVIKRQKELAANRNVRAELDQLKPCTFTFIYDNFNKTHGTQSSIYGDKQTNTVELVNRCALANPAVPPCPDARCSPHNCINSCMWSKDRDPASIPFKEIYVKDKELLELKKQETERTLILFKEVLDSYTSFEKISNWENTESELASSLISDETNNDQAFESLEREVVIENLETSLHTRAELRKAFTTKSNSHENQTRVILDSVPGKDTDPAVNMKILKEAINYSGLREDSERMFIGGDQKTMGVALQLKRLNPEKLKYIYITIPDLHFRKSMMGAILKKYEHLGLQHLAKLSGYQKEEQWSYLKNVASIHKSFEFFERIGESLRMTLIYEFIQYLFATKKYTRNNISQINKLNLNELLTGYIRQGYSDKVFTKNVELLEVAELITFHYTATRTSNWTLRTAVLKQILHFAVTSNCTHYGPLLIQLLFHQFSFQERYQELLNKGYFTYKLRENKHSANVGYDTTIEDVNLLAGQFRHKRQSVEQAVMQSNSIDALQKKQENLNINLNIKSSDGKPTFKDDRPTKIKLIKALLNFKSFQQLDRPLINEFASNRETFNEDVLKRNWYTAADFLIRRFITVNKTLKLCNFKSANEEQTLVLTEIAANLLKKIKQNTSLIVNIKPTTTNSKCKIVNKKTLSIKRKAKQYLNNLLWEDSPFENAAAFMNHDGSKLNTNKSKFREAMHLLFSNLPIAALNTKSDETPGIGEREWLSDVHINAFTEEIKKNTSQDVTITYPMPDDILKHMIQNSSYAIQNVIDRLTNCIIPLNTGSHWVTLFFHGQSKMVHYIDSFGSPMKHDLATTIRERFALWQVVSNEIKLQDDGYECGVWTCFIISCINEYLQRTSIQKDNDIKHQACFQIFLKRKLNHHSLKDLKQCKTSNCSFISNYRKHCNLKILSMVEDKETDDFDGEYNSQPTSETFPFKQKKLPDNVKFDVVSIDSQQSLWVKPLHVKDGIEYIKFLDKKYFSYYFNTIKASTVYWNYDLNKLIKSHVPKSMEQAKRDNNKKSDGIKSFSESRLLNEEDIIITDQSIIQDWSEIMSDRKKRNIIAKYVSSNLHHLSIPIDKKIVVNSEAVMYDDLAVPLTYQSNGKEVIKIVEHKLENAFVEGEGAAAAQVAKHHLQDNCLIISNDTDSLLYVMLAALKRERVKNKFENSWWLEIPILKKSSTSSVGFEKQSEYWDINNLIYAIESKMPDIEHPVESIVAVYLSAGSDITEKWYGKTHKAFLQKYIQHIKYIGDLVTKDGSSVSAFSYRKLIHCVWQNKSSIPEDKSFNDVRMKSKQLKNRRSHLPEEGTLHNHYRRVAGAFKYMSNYMQDNPTKLDWKQYGYQFDEDTQSFTATIFKTNPSIIETTVSKNINKINKNKTTKQTKLLKEAFNKNSKLDTKSVCELAETISLTKKQVQTWFSNERKRKLAEDKENVPPSKKNAPSDKLYIP